ncbi:MAG: ribosome small subunit-dependent GTPase A [Bacteroidota bacterium]
MNLADLGFDGWFRARLEEAGPSDLQPARVTRVDRERYLIRNDQGEVQAEPTGKLLFAAGSAQELPCVGDWVLARYHNEGALAIVHEVLPRKTRLRRKSPGRQVDHQMIAANIDVAFIVQSCDRDFNLRRLERYLVMAHEGGVEPVFLLSKSDLPGREELEERIAEVRRACGDARVLSCSTVTEGGLASLTETLRKRTTYCLLGSSGVGKTTLLNRLLGREEFETRPVREKDGRGRHTTARRELIILDGGSLLVDTPGMRELGMLAAGEDVGESFTEIGTLAGECRFGDCTHVTEPGCAILAAVREGVLSEERYESYLKLMKESAFHDSSYAERRRKEKQFGRMVKTAMDQLKKRKPQA